MAEPTYYQRRSLRDPAWREEAIATAAQRYRRAKEADPERVRKPSRAYRARLRSRSLTISQLADRLGVERSAGQETLRRILADEIRHGRVELVQGRYYRLNGGLPEDVKRALLALGPADDRR